ncbi:unnamed protein product [Oikopleura dioica]|uniref:Uncharacterized protein n=1 Tax=Oikopleura dioica TaxID=34765 RepID=E4XPH3_OIKDI|nr:unnamed protein product [Oikopleura dioica]
MLFLCPCIEQESDVFILVIPNYVGESYLQSGDGSSQISATIDAPENYYASEAAYALVNGKLHIFGGNSDGTKIARLDDCTLNELTVRLNEEREVGHTALSIENGKKALICFGWTDEIRKTCEIFDGSTTVSTFAADSTHYSGGLGLYKNQPTSVGCYDAKHRKAETLSATGWISLPDHPKRISSHSLVALENQSMLLIGGIDFGNGNAFQSGIWQLKDENWNEIGELLQSFENSSRIFLTARFWNIFVIQEMRFLLIILINLAQASLRQRETCNDQEINNECLAVCDAEYFDCSKNCVNSDCLRKCAEEVIACENSCPCGADCPTGCVDCPEHPLCADECEDAQFINNEYKICVNAAIYELDFCLKTCPPEIGCHNSCYENYSQMLFLCPCIEQETTTTTQISPIEPSDVFILVLPNKVDESYLQSGDGSSQISATINAPENRYARNAAYALVNGKLHIFGGYYDWTKIARLDDCTLNELTVRLNEERYVGHAALSMENGKKVLICFGWLDPASVGCYFEQHQKAETLSATGWTALPGHPTRISRHSLVALDNQSMLLIGGKDNGNDGVSQSGIWQLKDENWNKIGELLQADYRGSAIYIGRSIYYFGNVSNAIERLDFNEEEELQKVAQIGNQPSQYYLPVLFQTVPNYCI